MTQTSLQSAFSAYRVVANGVRIRSLLAPLNATGRLIVARVPMGKRFVGPNALTNSASSPGALFNRLTGMFLDTTGHVPVNILNLPVKSECTVTELLSKQMECSNRCIGDTAFEFRNASNTDTLYGAGTTIADEVIINAAGAVVYSDAEDDVLTDGWTCVLIRGEGFPASVASLDLEMCSHLEGVPNVYSSGATGMATYVSSAIAMPSPMFSVDTALQALTRIPFGKIVSAGQEAYRVSQTPMGHMIGRTARLAIGL